MSTSLENIIPGFITFRNLKGGGYLDLAKFNPTDQATVDINVRLIEAVNDKTDVPNGYINIHLNTGARVYIPASSGISSHQIREAIVRALRSP